MNYELLGNDKLVEVVFIGDVDIDSTDVLTEELPPLLTPYQDIIFNFRQVDFVDSSGIGLIIQVVRNIQEENKKIVIKNIQPSVGEVFALLQLPELLGEDVFQ